MLAAIDRLLPALARRLADKGQGARRVQCFRADKGMQWAEVGLARPSADPERIRPLLAMKLADIDDSHIPEKTATVLAAAWSEPASGWPPPASPRPLTLWRPEPVMADDKPSLPARWRRRGRTHATAAATGPSGSFRNGGWTSPTGTPMAG